VENVFTYIAADAHEIVAFDLGRLERLQREGFEVDICVPEGPGLAELEARFRVRSLPPLRDPTSYATSALLVHSHMVERPPMLVHGVGTPWAWLAAWSAKSVQADTCVATVEHHVFVPEDLRGAPGAVLAGLDAVTASRATRTLRGAYAWLGRQVDKYLVSNERDFRILDHEQLVDSSTRELVLGGRGVDMELFAPNADDAPDVESARRTLRLGDYRRVVGAVVPEDRASRTILREVIDAVNRRHASTGWILVGPKLGIARSVNVESPAPQTLFSSYLAADLWLEPLLTDWTGLNLMRAAASGCPAAAFETAAASTVIMQGHTGAFTQRRSSEALIELVESLLGDPSRLRDLGVRARSRAVSRFSRAQIDDQIVRLYDRVLRRRFM